MAFIYRRAENLPTKLSCFDDEVQLFDTVTGEHPAKGEFFGTLRLSPTGGIAEVGGLFKPQRYLSAVLFIVLLVLNTHSLIQNDMKGFYGQPSAMRSQLLLHEEYLLRVFEVTPELLIAGFELAYLLVHLVCITGNLILAKSPHIFHPHCPAEVLAYHRWDALARIFRQELPRLQAFSAMRTLQYITPGVFTPALQNLMTRLQKSQNRRIRKLLRLAWFLGTHLLFLFFGAEAFLVKFRTAAQKVLFQPESLRSFIQVFLFLNQMLGIVQLNLYTNERLFRFIFGGVDSYVDASERRRMKVWNAAFQKAAWDAFRNVPSRYIALSVTFNDVDFQRLVLDDIGTDE